METLEGGFRHKLLGIIHKSRRLWTTVDGSMADTLSAMRPLWARAVSIIPQFVKQARNGL